MKKLSAIALMLVLAAGIFTGCRRKPMEEPTTTNTTAPTQTTAMPTTPSTVAPTQPSTQSTMPSTSQPDTSEATNSTGNSVTPRGRMLPGM